MGIKSIKVNKTELLEVQLHQCCVTVHAREKENQNVTWDEGQFTNKYYCCKNGKSLKCRQFLYTRAHRCFSLSFVSGFCDLKRNIYTVHARVYSSSWKIWLSWFIALDVNWNIRRNTTYKSKVLHLKHSIKLLKSERCISWMVLCVQLLPNQAPYFEI